MTIAVTEQTLDTGAQCVVAAVQSVCEAIIAERPPLVTGPMVAESLTWHGIIGSISLVGDVEWALLLCLSETTAPALAERFTGFEIPFDSPDMGDAIGELANLLAGEIKVELDRVGVKANISLPQVFRTQLMELVRQPQQEPKLFVFESTCGPISLAITSSSG